MTDFHVQLEYVFEFFFYWSERLLMYYDTMGTNIIKVFFFFFMQHTNSSEIKFVFTTRHCYIPAIIYVLIIRFFFAVLNALDSRGGTPLHWSIVKNQLDSVRILLSRGANPNLLNFYRLAPIHMAIQLHHNTIVEVRNTARLRTRSNLCVWYLTIHPDAYTIGCYSLS